MSWLASISSTVIGFCQSNKNSRFWVNQIENVRNQGGLILLINRLERLGDDALIRDLLSLDLPEILRRTLSDHGFPTFP